MRFSYIDFHHGSVSVGDYLVIEGLAESFARELFGTERLGPWVTRFDHEDLQYSIDVINEVLDVKGFSEVSRYMFGDPIANDQGFKPAGLSAFAGYAVGYHASVIYESTSYHDKRGHAFGCEDHSFSMRVVFYMKKASHTAALFDSQNQQFYGGAGGNSDCICFDIAP